MVHLVARQAHNLKVVGSNPTPATTSKWMSMRMLRNSSALAKQQAKKVTVPVKRPDCARESFFEPSGISWTVSEPELFAHEIHGDDLFPKKRRPRFVVGEILSPTRCTLSSYQSWNSR